MSRDDLRPLTEAATVSSSLAPFAEMSGVGIADAEGVSARKPHERLARWADGSVSPRIRGQDKVRGALAPLTQRQSEPRKARLSRLSLGSRIEFDMARQRRSLHEKLEELAQLKARVQAQSAASASHSKGRKPAVSLDEIILNIRPKEVIDGGSPRLSLEDIRELEERAALRLSQVDRKAKRFLSLKHEQRTAGSQRHALALERKRRLLDHQAESQVSFTASKENVYDYYAIKIQSLGRRYIARKRYLVFRARRIPCVVKIQAASRGYLARKHCQSYRTRSRAAVKIQALFRGVILRMSENSKVIERSISDRCAVLIQKLWRGVLGRRRSHHKRRFERTVALLAESVDGSRISSGDLLDLARRLQHALYGTEEGATLPPDEVLHLIQMVSQTILHNADNDDIFWLSEISDLRNRSGDTMSMDDPFTWLKASRLLARSEKYLRQLRAVAFGPKLKPPRMVNFPANVVNKLEVLSKGPRWGLAFFATIGVGAHCCEQLFKWLTSLKELYDQQNEFISFFTTNFPEWLENFRLLVYHGHQLDIEITYLLKATEFLEAQVLKEGGRSQANFIWSVIENLKSELLDLTRRREINLSEQNDFSFAQNTREMEVMQEVQRRLAELASDERNLQHSFHGDYLDKSNMTAYHEWNLGTQRRRLEDSRLQLKALESRSIQLLTQHQINCSIRRRNYALPAALIVKAREAGVSKALSILAGAKLQGILDSNKASSYESLPYDERNDYDAVEIEKLGFQSRCEAQFSSTKQELEEMFRVDDAVTRQYERQQLELQAYVSPSEFEMEEERREDEREAKLEQRKRLQFVPDDILKDSPRQQRPLLAIFSRDLSASAKSEANQSLTSLFPAKFLCIDSETSLGLDVTAIQAVFDTGCWVIASADVGLTKLTRETFLYTLSIVVKSLVPVPMVIIAIGGEESTESPSLVDLQRMSDHRLKSLLLQRFGILESLELREMQVDMVHRSSLRSPVSKGYIPVLEALAILISDFRDVKGPQNSVSAVSWNASKILLAYPKELLLKLRNMQRGQQAADVVHVMHRYMNFASWPNSLERTEDKLLHALASFVEVWAEMSARTDNGGGTLDHHEFGAKVPSIASTVVISSGSSNNSMREGWCTPFARLQCAALKPLRVLKTVVDIEGQYFRVNVYRSMEGIFLSAYNPNSSEVFTTQITLQDASALLAPSKISASNRTVLKAPSTTAELYEQLARLLFFESSPTCSKRLVCRRRLVELVSKAMRLNGLRGILSCYSASMGDMAFSFHVPRFSTTLTFIMDAALRGQIAKTSEHAEERTALEVQSAVEILPFAVDRLALFPSTSMLESFPIHCRLKLKMKLLPPCGRLIHRRPLSRAGIQYILSVFLFSFDNSLRLHLYQPESTHVLTLEISEVVRMAVLRSLSPDPKLWCRELDKRLEILRNSFRVNTTLVTRVVDISRVKYIASLGLKGKGDMLFLRLYDKTSSIQYECSVTLTEIMEVLKGCRLGRPQRQTAFSSSEGIGSSIPELADMTAFLRNRRYLDEFLLCLQLKGDANISLGTSLVILQLALTSSDFYKQFTLTPITKNTDDECAPQRIKIDSKIPSKMKPAIIACRRQQLPPVNVDEAWRQQDLDAADTVISAPTERSLISSEEDSVEGVVESIIHGIVTKIEIADARREISNASEPRSIDIPKEMRVFKRAVKVIYRENSELWSRLVSIEVIEGKVWSPEEGVDRALRFIVYDPASAVYTEASIVGSMRLSMVLGKEAQDLLEPSKVSEMLLYICKYRMLLARNDINRGGEDDEMSSPPSLRVEFKADRIYSADKVTPVNAGGEVDFVTNKSKFIKKGDVRNKVNRYYFKFMP